MATGQRGFRRGPSGRGIRAVSSYPAKRVRRYTNARGVGPASKRPVPSNRSLLTDNNNYYYLIFLMLVLTGVKEDLPR